MKALRKSILLNCVFLAGIALQASAGTLPDQLETRVDAVVTKAYEAASAKFPCKLGGGAGKMLKWQTISKCLNEDAYDRVDWEDVSRQFQSIKKEFGLSSMEITVLVESSLAKHALPYEKVFLVKKTKRLLPLSSSLLKFLPEGSLQGLPVFEKLGTQVGTFSGVYSSDKIGGLSGNYTPRRLFQYTDSKGNYHGSSEKLLLDSFGVPWKDAASQPGFRLPPDKIILR
jgi:hypothetical protein